MSQGKNKGPSGALASDAAGNVYGVTYEGGADGQGTLFRINPIAGELVTLEEFTGASGAARGQNPIGGLVSDGKGGFLGATYHEGYNGAPWDNGTVFRYHPGTHTFTSLAAGIGPSLSCNQRSRRGRGAPRLASTEYSRQRSRRRPT